MKLDQQAAQAAGLTGFNTGSHIGYLTAKKTIANTGSHGVEFQLWFDQQSSISYLRVNYAKQDGAPIKFGRNILMAMMGLTGIQDLNIENLPNDAPIPEFQGKQIGFVLQKVLYTKNDRTDGYKFEIRMPFDPNTGKTYREIVNNEANPQQVQALLEELTDRDDRDQMPSQPQPPQQQASGFNSKVPF